MGNPRRQCQSSLFYAQATQWYAEYENKVNPWFPVLTQEKLGNIYAKSEKAIQLNTTSALWALSLAVISCKTAMSKKTLQDTIFNFLNRYSELWALLFSKLKKPVNLRIFWILRSANFGYRWNRLIGGILESPIIFLVFIFGRSYWFNKS